MPLVQTRGAASAQGFGEFAQAAVAANYIEDVFSTYLYTGTGAALTVTNNIDLSTYGGLTWIKGRSGATGHRLTDTARGATKSLASETTAAEATETTGLTAFGTTGFTIGADADYNTSAATYTSWTFREQPKFFDIVTYTGDGISGRTVAHNLGSVPGCIIVKRTDVAATWQVYHRGINGGTNPEYYQLWLNLTNAAALSSQNWNDTSPTSTQFTVGNNGGVNASGNTYVAYIFAHDAGGFGLAGTDNVISCGSFTTDPSTGAATVSLGYEPQWLLVKASTMTQGWHLIDNMRGMVNVGTYGDAAFLEPNTSDAESTGANCYPTANGFYYGRSGSTTYIYIACRRGPMKVPTSGTSVFTPIARTGTGANATVTSVGFPVDLLMSTARNGNDAESWWDRLRNTGGAGRLLPSSTSAEIAGSTDSLTGLDVMDGFKVGVDTNGRINYSPWTYVYHCFRRAPGFFDEVCYTGTGSNTTFTHNLGAVPELIIVKRRDTTGAWDSYSSALANTEYVVLNTTAAKATGATRWNSTTPTSSVFSVGTSTTTNASAGTYIAYLFATCAGVSKVGSYTGNGTTQTIDCGFTGGARFVLIKRTDSTGDWYVYDTARGMTVLTDPYLLLNSTAAEVATLGSVTTVSTGFALNSAILAAINVSAGTYIFLAIA
jgi:hypothetical protein